MAPVSAPRTPPSGASRLVPALLALLAAGCGSDAPPPEKAVAATFAASEVELEEEIVPDVLETKPIDEAENIGDPRFNSDAPFEGPGANSAIGVGGGAGGAFGAPAARRDPLASLRAPSERPGTEAFDSLEDNPFHRAADDPLSTFSADVDTASYAVVRNLLREGRLPPKGAVRIEEMVNYFRYDVAPPSGEAPFAVRVEAASAPWKPDHRLVRIAVRARVVDEASRPAANLVFLLDVSGSMSPRNKLPLVRESIAMLAGRLTAKDRVAIVVYAGASGLVLPSTPGDRREEILAALGRLQAGGSTNGGAGIALAYAVAQERFVPGGINRVILATDGDFNVGVTSRSDLVDLVKEKAKSKVFLTALGFGMGNLKDSTLEELADRGNGNYGYVDDLAEARKVLVEEGMSTLHAVAKDVKFQVEFNPVRVAGYRLLGYENRMLKARDFRDDAKDAGEVGAGHCVTALYEVIPAGLEPPVPGVDALRYREGTRPSPAGEASGETLTVKVRWKEPEGEVSTAAEFPFADGGAPFDAASPDLRFAASVAAFGMILRDSPHRGGANLASVREIAAGALGDDPGGYRAEFLTLVDRAAELSRPAAEGK